MSRISTFAANNLLLSQTLRTQKNLIDRQLAVTTEKKSQDYKGIYNDSRRLVNVENQRDLLNRYIVDNEQMDVRLKLTTSATDGIQSTLNAFRKRLNDFASSDTKDKTKVADIQQTSFNSLKSIQDLLNTEIDGKFLFSGSRSTTKPVDLGLTTLTAFQAKYDGATVKYPTSRDAHLDTLSVSRNNTSEKSNWLQFEERNATSGLSRITSTSGEFANLSAGSTITLSGTGGANDATYTVAAVGNGGTTLDLVTEQFTTAAASTGSISYQNPANSAQTLSVSGTTLAFTNNNGTTADTLTYTNDQLDSLTVGTAITIAGTSTAANNSTFTIAAINTTTNTISITPKRLTDQGLQVKSYTDAANGLTFTDGGAAADSITAPAGTFRDANGVNLVPGTQIAVSGTGTANDGNTYTIASVSTDGSIATLVSTDVATAAAGQNGTLATIHTTGSEYFKFTAVTNMTFTDNGTAADTISAPAGTFRDASGNNLIAGVQLTIAGTGSANDGATYTIDSVSSDGATVTLKTTDAVTTTAAVSGTATAVTGAGSVTVSSYFGGDQLADTHRVDENRSFSLDLNAANPAFEKGMRALANIAQGIFATEGGLDQNTDRISKALSLIDGALNRAASDPAPFGTTEIAGSIEQAQIDLGYHRVLISDTNKLNTEFIGFLDASVSKMENTDLTDALTRMLDDQRSLEASFQSYARIRQLSLAKFL